MICFRTIFRAAICLAVALSLQGCGRRGPPELPPNAATPGAPANGAADASKGEAGSSSATDASAAKPAAVVKAPPRPFPLDPLL